MLGRVGYVTNTGINRARPNRIHPSGRNVSLCRLRSPPFIRYYVRQWYQFLRKNTRGCLGSDAWLRNNQSISTKTRFSPFHMGEDEECSSAPSRRGGNAENGKNGAALDPEREKRYAELFEQLDLNKDGRVDINELRTGLATRGLQLREAEKVSRCF